MVVGAAGVPLRRVLWTTAIGYLPITALFVYLGSQLEELSPTDPVLWVGAIVLIAAIVVAHRMRHRLEDPGPGDGGESEREGNVPAEAGSVAIGELAAERDPD